MPSKIEDLLTPFNQNLKELLTQLENFDNQTLNHTLDAGKWSVLQHLEHLYLSEQASLAYIHKKSQFPETLEEVGEKGDIALEAVRLYFNTPNPPMPAVAPEWVTPKEDFYTFKDIADKYLQLRWEIAQTLVQLGENMLTKDLYRHPFAGKMNLYQAIGFFDLHFNHHLKAIKKAPFLP